MIEAWEFRDVTVYLVAVLGLLVVWQYYQLQIMAGRILAVDIFDRSGIRMYVYVTPDDDRICEVCAASHGRVFLPSQVAEKKFSPIIGKCQRPFPCHGALVAYEYQKGRHSVVERRGAGSGQRAMGTVRQRRHGSLGRLYDRSLQL